MTLIIDCHCHVFYYNDLIGPIREIFKGYGFAERIIQKMSEIKTITTKDMIEKTVFHVKHAKIDKVVLLPLSNKENKIVLEWVKRAPDIFIPFFNPPERGSEEGSIEDVVNRAIENDNIKGFKIMLPFRKKKLNDEVIFPILEMAEKHDLHVLMHTGYPPPGTKKNVLTHANPIHIESLLGSFSKVKIIIAHMGYPWVDIAIALAVQYPNIYLDISNLTYMMPNRLKELLLRAREIIGINKILFGSDGFAPEFLEITKNYFNDANFLTEDEINDILGKNASKILKL